MRFVFQDSFDGDACLPFYGQHTHQGHPMPVTGSLDHTAQTAGLLGAYRSSTRLMFWW